jgi:hypothetical protein
MSIQASNYAEHYGITENEAMQRFRIIETIPGKLQQELESQESDTFGGLWIQHTPDFKIIVAFTEDGEETIKKYLSDDIMQYVETTQVKTTLLELKNALYEAMAAFKNSGIPIDSGISQMNNIVEVSVSKKYWNKYQEAITSGKILLPDCVKVTQVDSLAQPL